MTTKAKLITGLIAVLAVVASVMLAVLWSRRGTEPATEVGRQIKAKATVDPMTVMRLPALARKVTEAPVAPRVESVKDEGADQGTLVVRLPVGQVLATVNNIPVTAGDLGAVSAEEREKMMSVDEYESRLQRAIDMNLTFQAAQAGRVGLTVEQQARLGEIWTRNAQRFEQMKAEYGTTRSTVTEAQLAFQERMTAALLLQQNLVGIETGAAPNPDPAKQAEYEAARREMLSKWRAAANIQIAPPAPAN